MRFSSSKDGRKYTLILIGVAAASVALFVGKATFVEWTYFMIPWGAFFLAANVTQHVKMGSNESNMVTGAK
jgi:hypothetical protein